MTMSKTNYYLFFCSDFDPLELLLLLVAEAEKFTQKETPAMPITCVISTTSIMYKHHEGNSISSCSSSGSDFIQCLECRVVLEKL